MQLTCFSLLLFAFLAETFFISKSLWFLSFFWFLPWFLSYLHPPGRSLESGSFRISSSCRYIVFKICLHVGVSTAKFIIVFCYSDFLLWARFVHKLKDSLRSCILCMSTSLFSNSPWTQPFAGSSSPRLFLKTMNLDYSCIPTCVIKQ